MHKELSVKSRVRGNFHARLCERVRVKLPRSTRPMTPDYVHNETVRHCEYCGKPMSRSDVNDYGSLCERCYIKEYYG